MQRALAFTTIMVGGLAVCGSVAEAAAPPKILGFGPDLITVLTKPPVKDKQTGLFSGVELQGEVISETVATTNGWRSMRATLDVSCADRRDRVRSMTVFSDHNERGDAKALTPPGDWISADQNTTYGLAVVKYFCGGEGGRAMARRAPPPSPPAETPPSPSTPQPAYALAAAPSAPTVSAPPLDTATESETTTNALGATVDKPAEQNDRVRASAKPVAAAPARASQRSPAGAFIVQVGSTPVESDARAILAKLKGAHAGAFEGLQTRIEPADVRGQHYFRAIIAGFGDGAAAARFCSDVHAHNGCIVRK